MDQSKLNKENRLIDQGNIPLPVYPVLVVNDDPNVIPDVSRIDRNNLQQ